MELEGRAQGRCPGTSEATLGWIEVSSGRRPERRVNRIQFCVQGRICIERGAMFYYMAYTERDSEVGRGRRDGQCLILLIGRPMCCVSLPYYDSYRSGEGRVSMGRKIARGMMIGCFVPLAAFSFRVLFGRVVRLNRSFGLSLEVN